jgi:regulator of sigma E protease
MLISIVAAVVMLGILVIVHEAGHFLMAKRCGVRVLRFAIGYPPKLWGFRRGETEYAICAIPFGGYVRMLGDEVGDEPGPSDAENLLGETGFDLIGAAKAHGLSISGAAPEQQLLQLAQRAAQSGSSGNAAAIVGRQPTPLEALLLAEVARTGSVPEAITALAAQRPSALMETLKARSFPSQSVLKRILIVVAGPLANFVFAPVALTIVLLYGVPHLLPVLGEVKTGMPAASAGLRTGDHILAIDDHTLSDWDALFEAVRASNGHALKVGFERCAGAAMHDEMIVVQPTRETGGNWIIGVLPRGDSTTVRLGPFAAVWRALIETVNMTGMLLYGIAEIVRGATPIREALGGPIMIAQLAGQQARQGFANISLFTVMLSIELAIVNLIPVPMLDGGHLFFFVVEGLRGKPIAMHHREMAQRVGLVVLVALMAFVIFNDISRIVQG